MRHGIRRIRKKPALPLVFSCRWPDSNRHGSLRMILSHVRLPIPPHRQAYKTADISDSSIVPSGRKFVNLKISLWPDFFRNFNTFLYIFFLQRFQSVHHMLKKRNRELHSLTFPLYIIINIRKQILRNLCFNVRVLFRKSIKLQLCVI